MKRPVELSGTIVSATATALVVRTPSGTRTVSYGPRTRFLAIDKSSLARVTANSFIGTTVVPQPNGTYRSTEVHIFAPALRGMGEGFTKMDDRGRHMMANSTVRTVERPHMMANSTVRTVGPASGGKTITMVFASGAKTITIPRNTPVIYIAPGTKTMLVPGARVRVDVLPGNGRAVARLLLVLEHGVALPM